MKIHRRHDGTIETHRFSGYLTISAIIIAGLLIFYALDSAKANEFSLTQKIEEQEANRNAISMPAS